jgi:Putative transposase
VRRPPIAQRRLLDVDNQEVFFLAKDTRAKRLVPTKRSLGQFIALLGQHFPDRYRHGIRRFGLLAPRTKGSVWNSVLLNLGEKRRPQPQRLRWRDSLIKHFGVDPLRDSHGEMMEWVRREGPVTS